jgi:predicted secreted protein
VLILLAAALPLGLPLPVDAQSAPGGSPERGAAIVADRRLGLCLLCHAAPLPDPHFHGTIGPPLHGVGARLSREQLRQRLLDPKRFNPETVMPAYGKTPGKAPSLQRVAPAFANQPVLSLPGDFAVKRRALLLAVLPLPLMAQELAPSLQQAIASITQGAQVTDGRISISVAELVENGNAVPVRLSVSGEGVQELWLLNELNPQREVLHCRFSAAAPPLVSTRVRLSGTQQLVALARGAQGQWWQARQRVIVTLAACLEGDNT